MRKTLYVAALVAVVWSTPALAVSADQIDDLLDAIVKMSESLSRLTEVLERHVGGQAGADDGTAAPTDDSTDDSSVSLASPKVPSDSLETGTGQPGGAVVGRVQQPDFQCKPGTAAQEDAFRAASVTNAGLSESQAAALDFTCRDRDPTSVCVAGETPAFSTEQVIDIVGVNAHLSWPGTIYDTQYDEVRQLLLDSGIKHVRTGVAEHMTDRLRELSTHGIDFLMVDTELELGHQLASELNAGGQNIIEAVEPPNEKDNQWELLCDHQKQLFETYNSDPNTSDITILGPSLANWTLSEDLGNACPDLGNHADKGNVHDYSGSAPESDMGGGYGQSQIRALQLTSQITGDKPVWSTENGWTYNGNPYTSASELGAAKMALRQILLHVNHQAERIYFYELVDLNQEQHMYARFGLVDGATMQPRPIYDAIKSFIEIISGGTASSKDALNYDLTTGNDVNNLLMSKGDGTFVLALWRGVTVTGGENRVQDVENEPASVTLTLPSAASVRQFLPTTQGTDVVESAENVTEMNLSVPDHVLLVEISGVECE